MVKWVLKKYWCEWNGGWKGGREVDRESCTSAWEGECALPWTDGMGVDAEGTEEVEPSRNTELQTDGQWRKTNQQWGMWNRSVRGWCAGHEEACQFYSGDWCDWIGLDESGLLRNDNDRLISCYSIEIYFIYSFVQGVLMGTLLSPSLLTSIVKSHASMSTTDQHFLKKSAIGPCWKAYKT